MLVERGPLLPESSDSYRLGAIDQKYRAFQSALDNAIRHFAVSNDDRLLLFRLNLDPVG